MRRKGFEYPRSAVKDRAAPTRFGDLSSYRLTRKVFFGNLCWNNKEDVLAFMNAAKRLAPLATVGFFLVSAPLFPSSLSLFWPGGVSSCGAYALPICAAFVIALVFSCCWFTFSKGRAFRIVGLCAIVGYVLCSCARAFASGSAIPYAILSYAALGLSMPVFLVWLCALSKAAFRESLGVSACSVVVACGLVLPETLGLVESPWLAALCTIVGSAYPCAIVLRANRHYFQPVDFNGIHNAELREISHIQWGVLASLSDYCSGAFLLVMSCVARQRAFALDAIPAEYRMLETLSLPIGAMLVLVLLATRRGNVDLSEVQSTYLPIFAALFFVLNAFGAETPLFGIGFLLSQAALGAMVVLAMSSVSSLWARGEASIALVVSVVLGGIFVAALLGWALAAFVDPHRVGVILLVVASLYFVGVMLNAIFMLRRLVEGMARGLEISLSAGESLRVGNMGDTCDALANEKGLTPREREVLRFVAAGHTSPYIANKLVISEYTVRTHMRNMYRKMGVSSKEELIQLVELRCVVE